MGIDIPVIWFVIIVFATLMYIVMDGFDLGIGMVFSFVPNANERDVMMNSVAPVWDGNETWLVLGGAGLFGAFPLAYAVLRPPPPTKSSGITRLSADRCWPPLARGSSWARSSAALTLPTAGSSAPRWTG